MNSILTYSVLLTLNVALLAFTGYQRKKLSYAEEYKLAQLEVVKSMKEPCTTSPPKQKKRISPYEIKTVPFSR